MSKKKIVFQVLSDLHLERFADFLHKSPIAYTRPVPPTAKKLISNKLLCPNRWIYTHPVTADYLLLVGDIGNPHIKNYHHYFDYCSPRYKQVFVVSGNHEYYFPHSFAYSKNITKNWMDDTEYFIKTIVLKYSNIHFLQNNYIELQHIDFQNILLYGATLWSPIPQFLRNSGYDLYKIPHWSWSMRNKIHMKHYHGIIDFIKYRAYSISPEYRKKSPFYKLIMTHYLPSQTLLLPKWKNSEYSTLFASSIWEELLETQSPEDINSIKGWFYGHTHQSSRDLLKQLLEKKQQQMPPINPIFFANPIGNIESNTKSLEDIVQSFETNVHISLDD